MRFHSWYYSTMLTLAACHTLWLGSAFANTTVAQAVSLEQDATNLKTCQNRYDYGIYLGGIHTGSMQRIETWYEATPGQPEHNQAEARVKSGTVESYSRASILGIGTRYRQKAQLVQSSGTGDYLTTTFYQKVSGFRSRTMNVTFSENGSESEVDLNGEVTHYTNHGQPLRDVDTLSIQIRHLVMQGKTTFNLTRQATDGPEPYHYQVLGAKSLTLPPWGALDVIQVEQTGAEEVTFWFAPSLQFALVQAKYHGFLFDATMELETMEVQCP
ncbi:hypothetical protein VTH8203_03373 [Vibrio thalassae]|uniref:DUF3108 domain-containing protein n=1 Tax=Vibrio thalassae TaxID=1243014 RepID=A0A240ENZ1_9VIBR|nr:DUF3108 domain-containing protein [Vibrio thalassae]SNX49725.1 hypothetical protein VTH8203_03373 [Vibrio thalassae]